MNTKAITSLKGILVLFGLVSALAHAGQDQYRGHGKMSKNFLAPGVMKTVASHAGWSHKKEIRGLVRKFKSAKKDMGKLLKAKSPDQKKIKQTRQEIKKIRQEFSVVIDKVIEANPELGPALQRNLENNHATRFLMRNEDRLKEFGAALGEDGEDFLEDFSEIRAKLITMRKEMREMKAGVDYGRIDNLRRKIRETFSEQRKEVVEAFSKMPQLREQLVAELKSRHAKHRKNRHGHGHGHSKDDGACTDGEDCDCGE